MEHTKMTRNKVLCERYKCPMKFQERGIPFVWILSVQNSIQAQPLHYKISTDRDRSEEEGDEQPSHSKSQITKVRRLERNNFENSKDIGGN